MKETEQPVKLKGLKKFICELLCAAGMNHDNAEIFTDVYMRATLRGVGHHDIYDISARLSAIHKKTLNPNPQIMLTSKYEALESYDGDNGPGELCCSYILDRGIELAKNYGIGFCTVRNSNHFLSAAPYVGKAAEMGYLALIFSRTNPCMGVPGSNKRIIGNAPLGYATVTNDGYLLMLDMCLAYASNGSLNAMSEEGMFIPPYWGVDAAGEPNTDPAAITNGGVPYAIGGHKGFGLALLVEILTGILSGGQVIDEPNPFFENGSGVYSQALIVLKTDGLMSMEAYRCRVSEMIERINTIAPGTRIPGEASHLKELKLEDDGSILLKAKLVDRLNTWAEKLGVNRL